VTRVRLFLLTLAALLAVFIVPKLGAAYTAVTNPGSITVSGLADGGTVETSIYQDVNVPQFVHVRKVYKYPGQPDQINEFQIQYEDYGQATVRVHETTGIAALVVNGSGQQYPAP